MKEKEIRALIERRRKEWRYGSSIEAKYRAEECDDILELMDEQEEPVSKDLELTWEDIKTIDKLLNQCVDYSNPYQEVLKRFKKRKEQ